MGGRFFRRAKSKNAALEKGDVLALNADGGTPITAAVNGMASVKIPAQAEPANVPDFVNERVLLHRFLLNKINLSILDTMEEVEIHDELRPLVRDYAKSNNFPLNSSELETLIKDIGDEMLGLGPIEPLLADDTISDILIVGSGTVFIERFGIVETTKARFKNEDHLMRIIKKIVASVGSRVDERSTRMAARRAAARRVNVEVGPGKVACPHVAHGTFHTND